MGSIRRVLARFSNLDDGTRAVPAWVAPIFLAMGVLLVPWIVLLFVTLPENYTAARWRLAWGGFDVGLAVSLGATAILVLRRSALTQTAAAITAAFLVCDAWFDVLTSRGRDVWFAIVLALLVELPLAALCIWIARSVERVLEDARPYLEAGGFTIRHRRLVVPPAPEELHGEAGAKPAPTSK
jgi:hypothetical protein